MNAKYNVQLICVDDSPKGFGEQGKKGKNIVGNKGT